MNQPKTKKLQQNFEFARGILYGTKCYKVGEINITSGKLVVGDFGNSITPQLELLENFPIGKFPVYYFHFKHAGSLILFDDTQIPTKWDYALYNSQTKKPLKVFKVAKCCFCYTDTDGLNAILQNERNNLYPSDFWYDGIVKYVRSRPHVLNFDIPILNSLNNLIFIWTGPNYQYYGSYIGYDKNGNIVCLYTDIGQL